MEDTKTVEEKRDDAFSDWDGKRKCVTKALKMKKTDANLKKLFRNAFLAGAESERRLITQEQGNDLMTAVMCIGMIKPALSQSESLKAAESAENTLKNIIRRNQGAPIASKL